MTHEKQALQLPAANDPDHPFTPAPCVARSGDTGRFVEPMPSEDLRALFVSGASLHDLKRAAAAEGIPWGSVLREAVREAWMGERRSFHDEQARAA